MELDIKVEVPVGVADPRFHPMHMRPDLTAGAVKG
jgi:hypothetical protein